MRRVAIIGGGLAGLSAAFDLARAGTAFELFEASGRLGGMVRSSEREGFLIEHGADSWIATKPWLEELARDLGMEDEIVASPAISPSTSILRNGELTPLPRGLSLFVPTDLPAIDESHLFSAATKRRFHQELQSPPKPLAQNEDADESVAQFVERHFGGEVVKVLAGPLLAGVYGGDADKLSARAVIPGMVAMEAQYGSLIAGAQAARQAARHTGGLFRSVRRGMGSLVERLASMLPEHSVHLNAAVSAVKMQGESYSIRTENQVSAGFSHVVLALPVLILGQILGLELPEIRYSSAATVALAYDSVPQLPAGFGFLVACGEPEPCPVMAATFVQQKWPERVPSGKSMIRAFVSDPMLLAMDDDGLANAARQAFAKTLGIMAVPAFASVDRWPSSMPQYELGHLARVEQILATVAQRYGKRVLLAGNSYYGVGMPDAVRSGREAAKRAATEDTEDARRKDREDRKAED
ncbi:MAG: protoporphyrinogen oxidase [Acidobacteriaceae bacterium]